MLNFYFLIALSAHGAQDCASRVKELTLEPSDLGCLRGCYIKASDTLGNLDDGCRASCRSHCDSTIDFHFFFSNGILSSRDGADRNLREALAAFQSEMKLQQPAILDRLKIVPRLAYNQSHGFLGDLASAAFQGLTEIEAGMFFYFLKHLDRAPPRFRELMQKKLTDWAQIEHQANVVVRKSAQQMLGDYYRVLKGPRPGATLVVTHSQGNLFFSHLVPLLRKELEADPNNHFASYIQNNDRIPNLSAVQTALPTYATDGLNQAPIRKGVPSYFTLQSDGFIKLLSPLAPPPTIDNETGGLFEHFFSEHYLRGKNSGPAIRRSMVLEACWLYLSLFDPDDHNDVWGMARTDDEGYCSM